MMINILIADDKAEKQQEIKEVLSRACEGYENITIDSAGDVRDAKRIMGQKDINIMILDLHFPIHFVDGPVYEGGINLINEIKASKHYNYPTCVI